MAHVDVQQKEFTKTMETNINYTAVGAFVVFLVAVIVVAIIWLSSGFSSEEEFARYQVNMKESVSGLNVDSPVEYNGVKVGTVESMLISHKNPQQVALLLKIQKDTPVTLGTKAKLDARALTGVAFIQLEDKGTNMQPLVAQPGQKYPLIPTTPSIFVRLETALTQINNSFQQLSKSVHGLLDDENLDAIKRTLKSTQSAMRTVETKTVPSTNKSLDNFEKMSKDLSSITADIKRNPSVLVRGKETSPESLGPGER